MSPELVKYSRIMHLVVIIGLIIFLLSGQNTWVDFLFSSVLGVLMILTAWQLWNSYQNGD